jgi:hypothetical protein
MDDRVPKKTPDLLASLFRFALTLAVASWVPSLLATEPTPEQAKFFESKIRPILVENCQRCHGEKKQSGSLRLD